MELQNKRKKGKYAEDIAKNFLLNKGYDIISQNYFKRYGEIDIIAREKEVIVFVEVKSLYSEGFIEINETISKLKRMRLINLANMWIWEYYKRNNIEFRIDFLGIVFEGSKIKRILHLENSIY